ncbi:DUF2892 domain-containing protein [Xanthocytophaga agilis]|uniref:DUF2892 domain-containing protein n=1 Tax=Xanthocytophaga agilis TaxID=3048010 RepID=A0AAE3RA06_9BACT|nr:DUF2892 domain-containing protein [Xanthocytophaga agilis]MDJ1503468.1 DUF2892 domain-containing protein [Xanthocytophaga agilis]
MNTNMGSLDRSIRFLVALLIGSAGIYFQSWWGLVAIIPLVTAFVSQCPLYTLLGISTKPLKSQKK